MCGETQSVVAVPHPAWARRQYILDHVVQVKQQQLYDWVNTGRVRIWKGDGDERIISSLHTNSLQYSETYCLISSISSGVARLAVTCPGNFTVLQSERRNILPPCIPVHGKLPTIGRSPPPRPRTMMTPPA